MIESRLILNIVDESLFGEKYEEQMRKQLNFLTEIEYEHTGSGLLVFFEADAKISKCRLNDSQLMDIFGENDHELTKFELINHDLKIQADVTVHFSNGTLDRVEIWNKLGDYPEDDLGSWELIQING
jgi:hypothetical protein